MEKPNKETKTTPKKPAENKVVKDLYTQLSKPIEKEYLISYEENGEVFTGYNAQCAINRLNEVVGLGRWRIESNIRKEEIVSKAWVVSMDVTIIIYSIDEKKNLVPRVRVEGTGAAFAKDIANAYKGARTSGFKNACKYLGIGKELYIQTEDDDIKKPEEPATGVANIEVPTDLADLEKKISEAKTVEQLQSLKDKLDGIKEKKFQVVIFKKYNDKKIELMS